MVSFLQTNMPRASSLFSDFASISALAALIPTIFKQLIPEPIRDYLLHLSMNFIRRFFKPRSNKLTLISEENLGRGSVGRNTIYEAAELYLSTKIKNPSTGRLKISQGPNNEKHNFKCVDGETIEDYFKGAPFTWCFYSRASPSKYEEGRVINHFEVTGNKTDFDLINSYLNFVVEEFERSISQNKQLKLCAISPHFGRGFSGWEKTNLNHPSTFDTLALDADVKEEIKADLDRFVARKEFYEEVGRAWKRGYLLYGPPGTGKSSLIAAMANYLRFDVYDLQLGNLITDSDLRRLLLATANRSILVVEDIDCSVEIKNRKKEDGSNDIGQIPKLPEVQFTLSGLLNFIDGLWSSCGDERIIVFTTNHKERLDPALLRPGRMDKHIHMSYLTTGGFRQLAKNYLEIEGGHGLFGEIERLIGTIQVTPAQVAEELMRSEDADVALEGVRKLLLEVEEKVNSKEEVNLEDGHEVNGPLENGHVIKSSCIVEHGDIY